MDIGILIHRLPISYGWKVRLNLWVLKIREFFSKKAVRKAFIRLERTSRKLEKQIRDIVTALLRTGDKERMLSYLRALQAQVEPLQADVRKFEGHRSQKSYQRELDLVLGQIQRLSARLEQMESMH